MFLVVLDVEAAYSMLSLAEVHDEAAALKTEDLVAHATSLKSLWTTRRRSEVLVHGSTDILGDKKAARKSL